MSLTKPQVKVLLKVHANPSGTRMRFKGGEWIAARSLRDKRLLSSTFPVPELTAEGRHVADVERLKRHNKRP